MHAPPAKPEVPGVTFVDQIPPRYPDYDSIRAALRERPGEWAQIYSGLTKTAANGRAVVIRRGADTPEPAGVWEAAIRREAPNVEAWSVYARLAPTATP